MTSESEAELIKDPNRIELSNGVVLKIKTVSRNAISYAARNAMKEHPEPQPPMKWIEDRGRDEPNPNDPAYQESYKLHQIEVSARVLDVLYARAIEVVEIPDDVGGPESKEFQDYVNLAMGEELRESELGRWVQWLRYWAVPDGDDLDLQRRLFELVGVPVQDIRVVEATFQGDAGGKPDTGNGDLKSSKNGD